MGRSRLMRWVSPFGDLRITGCSPLPEAFRRVPRPSSPLGAKASTKCPYLSLENLFRSPCANTLSRNQASGASNQDHVFATRKIRSYEHTRSVTEDRDQASGIRPEDNTIPRSTPTPDAPASVTDPHQHPTSIAQAAPDRHRLRGDRRLAGCQNPLHIVQDPGDRNQEPGYRPPFTAS
jgi:hypothetical protein